MEKTDIEKQMAFILECDKQKEIFRHTILPNSGRRENDAEHAWHLALICITLSPYFPEADLSRVLQMVICHDLVEIYAGDTYVFDEEGAATKAAREAEAADKLFAMLPAEQGKYFMELWHEFEANSTPSSRFANIADRLQPGLLNLAAGGLAWTENNITRKQVLTKNAKVLSAPEPISNYFLSVINKAYELGYLK
ncbi:MAG: HD domain-containing protein [Firmicutes bacterium]|nr:HD domain-containing protein [Bacillota bacterium]